MKVSEIKHNQQKFYTTKVLRRINQEIGFFYLKENETKEKTKTNLSVETMPSNSLEVMVGVFQYRALFPSILSLKTKAPYEELAL